MKPATKTDGVMLVPSVEEVRRLSGTERQELRFSLERARADIARGHFDVVTSATLKTEFDGIFEGDLTDEDLDARLAGAAALKR